MTAIVLLGKALGAADLYLNKILFEENKKKSVISFSPARDHPLWCFEFKDGLMKKYIK